MDLVTFLRARLDEDETVSRAALGPTVLIADDKLRPAPDQATHVRRHDPARVLREVEAKRRIVDRYADVQDGWVAMDECPDCLFPGARWLLQTLALSYSDHPDYRPEWAPAVKV